VPEAFVLETLRGYLLLAQRLYEDGSAYSGAWNFGPAQSDIQTVEWIAAKLAALLVGLPPSEAKQSTEQARQIFIGLQNGKIDRTLFTKNCNAYFDAQALGDFESSLKPLGPPLEFRQIAKELRGGMTFRIYDVFFPHKHLNVTTYQMRDGKIEQYLVIPAQ